MKNDYADEVWSQVEGFEGEYEVSNCGRVRSCDKSVGHRWGGHALKRGRILSIHLDRHGYSIVSLCRGGRCIKARVHRLVAEQFVANPKGAPQVNHIDGNRQNAHSSNLEWVSHAENLRHARDYLGRWKGQVKNPSGYNQYRKAPSQTRGASL